jgi:hypothetical protein
VISPSVAGQQPTRFSNFKGPAKLEGDKLDVLGRHYYLRLFSPISENGKPKSREFSTNARGRWYSTSGSNYHRPKSATRPPSASFSA